MHWIRKYKHFYNQSFYNWWVRGSFVPHRGVTWAVWERGSLWCHSNKAHADINQLINCVLQLCCLLGPSSSSCLRLKKTIFFGFKPLRIGFQICCWRGRRRKVFSWKWCSLEHRWQQQCWRRWTIQWGPIADEQSYIDYEREVEEGLEDDDWLNRWFEKIDAVKSTLTFNRTEYCVWSFSE